MNVFFFNYLYACLWTLYLKLCLTTFIILLLLGRLTLTLKDLNDQRVFDTALIAITTDKINCIDLLGHLWNLWKPGTEYSAGDIFKTWIRRISNPQQIIVEESSWFNDQPKSNTGIWEADFIQRAKYLRIRER